MQRDADERDVSRRELIQTAVLAGADLTLASITRAAEVGAVPVTTRPAGAVPSRWLDSRPNVVGGECGVTWGVPWQRGQVGPKQTLRVEGGGKAIPAQTWPTAYWPDGSIKW